MYVCLCNSIRCSDVRSAAGAGASTPGGVYRHMGCRPQCGRCRDTIVEVLSAPAPLSLQSGEAAGCEREPRS
ncbi:MAG: (2Fe-2S)-binding protein [Alphaproteobacteria bacterium]|nr:(2Fe-2S)-binding protein [Alphaproteobacteria bacterium]